MFMFRSRFFSQFNLHLHKLQLNFVCFFYFALILLGTNTDRSCAGAVLRLLIGAIIYH